MGLKLLNPQLPKYLARLGSDFSKLSVVYIISSLYGFELRAIVYCRLTSTTF